MAKIKEKEGELRVEITRQVEEYLDDLVATGLYGNDRGEVALRLIEREFATSSSTR